MTDLEAPPGTSPEAVGDAPDVVPEAVPDVVPEAIREVVPEVAGSPVVVLEAVTAAVAGLGDTWWAARTPGELVGVVTGCERLRSVLDAVELAVVAEVEATGAAAHLGWASTKDFVTAVAGQRRGYGPRLVRLATALSTDRAATGAALAAGAISRAQAQVITAAVDRLPGQRGLRAAAEALLIEQAGTRDATELAEAARTVLERLDPDGVERRDEAALAAQERSAHLGRFLAIVEDGLGGVHLKGRGSIEDAAHLKAMLLSLSAPDPTGRPGACGGTPGTPDGPGRPDGTGGAGGGGSGRSCGTDGCAHDGRDPREHGTRMWDALIEASRLLSSTDLLPTSHGQRPRIGITIAYDALTTQLGSGILDTGERLSAAAVRRLACDAEILPYVLGSRSQILDVGRTSRLVTLGIWLALIARDRHCAFPGCRRPPIACDAHHLLHWIHGGPTSLDNLVLVCRTHHTLLHTTPWQVRLHPHDHRPEFVPPPHLDPTGTPRRRQPLRT